MRLKISFDDGTVQDLKIAELIEKHGFVDSCIFYFPVMPEIANGLKGRESLSNDQMKQIASKFEIGSHTITHPLLTRIPLEQARTEIIDSKMLLEHRFDKEIKSFCYPRGYSSNELRNFVKEAGYTTARSTIVGCISKSEDKLFEKTSVHMGCDRREYDAMNWYEYANHLLEQASKIENSVFSIWSHGWELESYPKGFELFEELLIKLKSHI